MGKTIWQVQWFSATGEECVEDFDNKSDAQNFLEYNDWQKNEHPKLTECEVENAV